LQPLLQKNIYGWWNDEGDGMFGSFVTYFNWNVAESAAMAQARPGRRHWTLNRSFSPGMQRLGAAVWTGDIQARWDVLKYTPTNLLNWSLAGMPYTTCDIGGYSPETNAKLLSRWMESGVFYPILHTHSETGRTPHFPWLWGPDAEKAITGAIDLRYRFIPYFYSLAYETHETGYPLMRPLVMEFPDDLKVAETTDEWLIGSRLLAAPILDENDKRTVYLPADDWFRFETTTKLTGPQSFDLTAGLDEIPAYVRAGTILTLGPVVQNTDQIPGGPLEVEIYPGKDATFTLAEDDGETTDYLQGAVRRTTFTWNDAARKLSWSATGNYAGPHGYHDLNVVVFDPVSTTPPTPIKTQLTETGSLDLPR
jgi:alpha-glucosidase